MTSILESLESLLDRLPQVAVIDPAHRQRWLGQMAGAAGRTQQTFADLAGHVRRLSGFHDGEIGSLVATGRGLPAPFNTPSDIVSMKLLITPPESPTREAQREQRALDTVRALFAAQNPGARHLAAESAALGAARHPEHRWMIGSIDDVYAVAGEPTLVRFRVPDVGMVAAVVEAGEVPLDWACETHQQCMLAEGAGVDVRRMLTVMLDTDRWMLRTVPIELDTALQDEIVAGGARFWRDYVLAGEIPDISTKIDVDGSRLGPALEKEAGEYAAFAVLAGLAKERAGLVAERIARAVKAVGHLGDQKVMWPVTNVTARPVWDVEGMAARLVEAGGDPSRWKVDGEYDAEMLANQLRALDVDPTKYRDEVLTVSLPKTRKGPAARAVETLREEMSAYLDRSTHRTSAAVAVAEEAQPHLKQQQRGPKP